MKLILFIFLPLSITVLPYTTHYYFHSDIVQLEDEGQMAVEYCKIGDIPRADGYYNRFKETPKIYTRKLDGFYKINSFALLPDIKMWEDHKVVFINYSPHHLQNSLFIYKYLEMFRNAGYTNLVFKSYSSESIQLGSYSMPVIQPDSINVPPLFINALERALTLGYRIHHYWEGDRKEDKWAEEMICDVYYESGFKKTLVLVEDLNISEIPGRKNYSPLAWRFNQYAGINPFTISQTEDFNLYDKSKWEDFKAFYFMAGRNKTNYYFPATRDRSADVMLFSGFNNQRNSLEVLHDLRKHMLRSADQAPTLVKAYRKDSPFRRFLKTDVPYDVLVVNDWNKDAYLWLEKGFQYDIVYLDDQYKEYRTYSIPVK
ncbi:MAG TPA: hypothetical protein PKC30_02840 [Saprospiraceae bacterium]|nr:hypothetical protein [Saprospiraceae bacterium]